MITMMPGMTMVSFGANHTHNNITFEAINDENDLASLFAAGGSGYLADDIALSADSLTVSDGYTVNLCLNGKVIRLAEHEFNVDPGATLNLYDCKSTEKHMFEYIDDLNAYEWEPVDNVASADCTLSGGVIFGEPTDGGISSAISNYGTFNMYGGNIFGISSSFGGIYVYSDNADAEFNMYGGKISHCDASFGSGGGVYIDNNITDESVFNMYGGEISDNQAGFAGGIYVAKGSTFVMKGGKICNNVATPTDTAVGGGIVIEDGATFVGEGGEIVDNAAFNAGGGVYVSKYEDTNTCLAAGTPITLADGSRKAIENLKIGDEVRVFDHDTGKLSTAKLFDLWKFPEKKTGAFTLHFTNDVDVTAVGGHCFFEKESNKYVDINTENANNYINHKFYNADANRWETLESVDYLEEAVDTYIIVSEKKFNTLANGMLSNVDGLYTVLCNIFDLDSNLKVDAEKKAADIEKYGLWDYDEEHFHYVTEDTYNALNLQYLGVAIGKGLLTQVELEKAAAETLNYNTDLVKPEKKGEKKSSKGGLLSNLMSAMVLTAYAAELPQDPGVYLGGNIKITDNVLLDFDYVGYIMDVVQSGPPYPEGIDAEFVERVQEAGNSNDYGKLVKTLKDYNLPAFVDSNLHLWGDYTNLVTLGTGSNGVLSPTSGMSVGVSLKEETDPISDCAGAFTTNGTAADLQYFTVDSDCQYSLFDTDHLDLALIPNGSYKVKIDSAENGSVVAKVGGETIEFASADATVNIVTTPNSGYKLEELSVLDASGNAVTVTNNTFTMPSKVVTIKAKFTAESTGGKTELERAQETSTDIIEDTAGVVSKRSSDVDRLVAKAKKAIENAKSAKEVKEIQKIYVKSIKVAKVTNKARVIKKKINASRSGKIEVTFKRLTLSNKTKVKKYEIYRKQAGKDYKKIRTVVNGKKTNTITYTNLKGLKKNKKYSYRVRGLVKLADGSYAHTGWSKVQTAKCKRTR